MLVFAMAARTPLDTDMWWHLRAGEETWLTGRPVTIDTFSYTRYGQQWINHSWLSQVGMYLLFKFGGYLALGAAVAVLAALSMAFVYAQMDGHPLLRAFVLVLAVAVAAKVWSPRPQLVSLVLFGITGYLMYLYKWRGRDRLWMLPILFILWSNLHGGYVLGLLLLGSLIAGEVINHLLGHDGQEVVPWRGIRKLSLWALASALVVVINPNGLAMWLVPFRTVEVRVLQNLISEWASPDFHDLSQQPFLWLLFGTLGAAGISRRRVDGSDLAAVLGFAYLALLARRNFGPFAMVAAPVLSRHLWAMVPGWSERIQSRWPSITARFRWLDPTKESRQFPARTRRILNGLILGLLAAAGILKLYVVSSPDLVDYFERQSFPKEAVAWIKANDPPENLFGPYNWGGYLLWSLPQYPVFVDGRTDLYNDQVLEEYLQIASGGKDCLAKLDDYSVNTVLVENNSGLGRVLAASVDWESAFQDDQAEVFVRKSSVTLGAIRRY